MAKICSIGELLIDFTPSGKSPAGNDLFERNPGGGPANVAAAVAKLGERSSFLGKVGKDSFGVFLKKTLDDMGVDTKGLIFSDNVNTTLAFVHLNEKGDRSFSFYRNPGADMMYEKSDILFDLIDDCEIFHFSSVSLTHEPSRIAVKEAVKYAKRKNKIISYDPNLRLMLWDNPENAKREITEMLPYADILKVSEEELKFLTGDDEIESATRKIFDFGIQLIFSTLGPKGCLYMHKNGCQSLKTYDTAIVDTTGSGDAFAASVLFKVIRYNKPISELTNDELYDIADFANAAGSMTATKKGAIPAMPDYSEVEKCRKTIRIYEG